MESNAAALMRKFESIKVHADRLYMNLEQADSTLLEAMIKIPVSSGARLPIEVEINQQKRNKIVETRMVLKEYNDSLSNVYKITNMLIPTLPDPSAESEAKGVLRQMCIECDEVVGFLNASIMPLSLQEAD
jgi:hypothetical protein